MLDGVRLVPLHTLLGCSPGRALCLVFSCFLLAGPWSGLTIPSCIGVPPALTPIGLASHLSSVSRTNEAKLTSASVVQSQIIGGNGNRHLNCSFRSPICPKKISNLCIKKRKCNNAACFSIWSAQYLRLAHPLCCLRMFASLEA